MSATGGTVFLVDDEPGMLKALARLLEAEGFTVADVLRQVFAVQDRLGHYVLDDQGGLRKHMTILVDGQRIGDLDKLTDPVTPASEVWVMQALSGG